MSPITHLFIGWSVANVARLERRERAAVTLAGVVPDLDGVGIVADVLTRSSERPLTLYADYHHVLGHNLLLAVVVVAVCGWVAERKLVTAGLAALSFHLHLIGDLLGSRGPDGSQWEIYYLWPFSYAWPWKTDWQWELNAWPNFLITGVALALTLYLAWRRGYSPVEMVSRRADAALVATLRQRFGAAPQT